MSAQRRRQYELHRQPLGGGWVEMRIVFESPERDEIRLEGEEARLGAALWSLTFASQLADALHAHQLATSIRRLWDYLQGSRKEDHH